MQDLLASGEYVEATVTSVERSSLQCIVSEGRDPIVGTVNGVRYNLVEKRAFATGDVVRVRVQQLQPSVVMSIEKSFIKPLLVFDVHGVLGERTPFQKYSKKTRKFVLRPHCEEFLKFCFKYYEVAVWSSALLKNVTLSMFSADKEDEFSPLFVWSQADITDLSPIMSFRKASKPLYLKELSRLWECFPSYDSTYSLLLDNDLEKCAVCGTVILYSNLFVHTLFVLWSC
jgi:hypothetical protein